MRLACWSAVDGRSLLTWHTRVGWPSSSRRILTEESERLIDLGSAGGRFSLSTCFSRRNPWGPASMLSRTVIQMSRFAALFEEQRSLYRGSAYDIHSDLFATSGHISPAMFRGLLILGASSLDLSPVGGGFSAESGWFAELWRRRRIRITTGLAERARLRWRAAGYRNSRALSS